MLETPVCSLLTAPSSQPMDELCNADADAESELPQSRPKDDDPQPDAIDPPQSRSARRARWTPVRIRTDLVSVDGGYSSAPHMVESITIADSAELGGTDRFIKVCKNTSWFMKMVGGPQMRKGGLRHVDVLDTLRDKVERKSAANEPEPAVAEQVEAVEAVDPMDALDGSSLPPPVTSPKHTQRPKRLRSGSTLKSRVLEVDMLRDPLCVDPNSSATRPVKAYLSGATKRELWVHVDSLEWVINYAAEQIRLQGVVGPAVAEWEAEYMPANCPKVPNLRIDWSFTSTPNQWIAIFVDGPYKGVKKSLPPIDHTHVLWSQLRRYGMVPNCESSHGLRTVHRAAAKQLLIAWCDAIARDQQHKFESEWGLPECAADGDDRDDLK